MTAASRVAKAFSTSSPQGALPQMPNLTHVRRFYKKVDVIEHPLSAAQDKLDGEAVTLNNLSKADTYFAVTLDGRVTKTLYKDDLVVPSRALAVAIAEEWDMQGERVDMKTLKLNQMLAKAVRSCHDPYLVNWMRTQVQTILENDQICFHNDPLSQNEYKRKLAEKQQAATRPLFQFMSEHFGVNLKVWHNIPLESQDPSVAKISPVLEAMDPLALNSVFQATQTSKSAALALALIFRDGSSPGLGHMSLEECVNVARLDERHQQSVFGVVEGAHDFDHANTLSTFAAARAVVGLSKLRDF